MSRRFMSLRVPLCLMLALFLCPAVAFAQGGEERPPIIDMHLHAFDGSEFGPVLPRNPITGTPAPSGSPDALWKATLAELERYNIVTGVASGSLEVTERWRKKGKGRIIGAALFTRMSPFPTVEELEKAIRAKKIQVMGEFALQYMGISPADPDIDPYLKLADKYDLPVGFHTGIGPPGITNMGAHKFEVGMGDPKLLEPVLKKYPKLRVYIMHGGYPYLESTKAIMYVYPQVYTDLSVINWVLPQEEFHRYVEDLVRAGFGDRLMFGSDQQLWPDAIGPSIQSIEAAPSLTEKQKRDIFYHNAKRFLRLEE